MKTLHVNVTKDDIHVGQRNDCTRCPIALAVRRAMHQAFPGIKDGACHVHVTGYYIVIFRRFLPKFEHWNSSDVRDWIESFDSKEKVRPISFTMSID